MMVKNATYTSVMQNLELGSEVYMCVINVERKYKEKNVYQVNLAVKLIVF